MMAVLPPARVCPSRPFTQVEVDYAGPFLIKEGRLKQSHSVKGYRVLFICMMIKAVHIEVVSDLTTVVHCYITPICVATGTPVRHIFGLWYEFQGRKS